jgi:hypothetical protein
MTSSNQNPLEVRLPPALESRMFGSAPAQPSTFAAQSPMLLHVGYTNPLKNKTYFQNGG